MNIISYFFLLKSNSKGFTCTHQWAEVVLLYTVYHYSMSEVIRPFLNNINTHTHIAT